MKALEKVLYVTGIVCAFAYGLVTPLLAPTNVPAEITALLGNSQSVTAMAALICAVASATTMYFAVRAARSQPMIIRFLLKSFALMLPATATGLVVAMVFVSRGVCKAPQSVAFLGISAATYLCGGVAGIAAMSSIPEYKRILQREKDAGARS